MYNLLVTANTKAWESNSYSFYKNRFLEFTNDDIYAVFKSFNKADMDKLKSYPCLFAYEGFKEGIKLGWLTDIEESSDSVIIEFEVIASIENSSLQGYSALLEDLDIRSWETHRTHWAVKDKDLFRVLDDENLYSHPGGSIDNESPVNAEETERKSVTSLEEFVREVLSSTSNHQEEVFYRGHANSRLYDLVPSLFRRDKKGNYLYKVSEHVIFRELLISNSKDFQNDTNALDMLIRMQHYSMPTRLLDITSNPLMGLYFACKSSVDEESEDGEVIVLKIDKSEIKYYDSDTVSCVSNLAKLSESAKESIDYFDNEERPNQDFEDMFDRDQVTRFNKQEPIRRLLHFIKEEKAFFEPHIIPRDLKKIVCVKAKQNNDRILVQSGAFLLFGQDAVIDDDINVDIDRIYIESKNKKTILKELDLMNINDSTVFPYIENSAKYIAEKFRFKPDEII
ncbi:FRG domain-containing protein [Cobetia marina]|uniref:FRG domain-containing protein n=1 Tax=Cobetia marina TaxID=28258 RepID=UPI003857C15A